MRGKSIDLTGQRIGKLIVIELTDKISSTGNRIWKCKCDCGNYCEVTSNNLLDGIRYANGRGGTKSCGCLLGNRPRHNKDSLYNGRIYRIWRCMKNRCEYEKSKDYPNYGGRGIKICKEWKHDFMAFQNWALLHGYEDNLTIDRINNDGNYEPSNCRWATKITQLKNRRRTAYPWRKELIVVETGKYYDSIAECARHMNIKPNLIQDCLNGKRDSADGYHFKQIKNPVEIPEGMSDMEVETR